MNLKFFLFALLMLTLLAGGFGQDEGGASMDAKMNPLKKLFDNIPQKIKDNIKGLFGNMGSKPAGAE